MEEDLLKKTEDERQNNNENNFKGQKNSIGLIVGLLILIIVGLIGYIVYDKVIKKDDLKENEDLSPTSTPVITNTPEPIPTSTPTPTSTPGNNNSSNNYDYSLIGKTFKTSDGKKSLKIVSKNDKEALSKAKKLDAYESLFDEVNYLGYYNGKIILLFDDNSNEKGASNSNSKYIVLGGQSGVMGQCRDSNGFIINVADSTLVNLSKGSVYDVRKVGEKYYFLEGYCALSFLPIGVYNESLKKIGYYYFDSDSSENIYVLENGENGSIIKYDKNGSIVKKTNQKYMHDDINKETVSFDNTLYIIAKINDKLFLIDVSTEEKYALSGLDEEFAGITDDKDAIAMAVNNNLIEISRYTPEFDEKIDDFIDKYEIVYKFNPKTKKLEKNN